jgi:chromosome partitioning protein
MCKVIAVAMQKGGCAKTSVSLNLGIGLARTGKKVLLIDNDPQGSLTASLGYDEPDEISHTLASIMMKIINEETIEPDYGILHHREGIDLIPANIELSGLEVLLANVMSRENILKEYLDQIKDRYEYIIIDCMPSLGMMTINALVAATTVLIPVPAAYLPVKGLQQLIKTISMVRKRLNKRLAIEGILLTMVDYRTNYARDISEKLREGYGATIGMFDTYIPFSVKAAECSSEGVSIFVHEPKGKVADAYQRLTEEVLSHEK